jgi:YkoY family integral membrane protein
MLDSFLIAFVTFFGQSVEWPDLAVIGLLIILEGLLSIDNALVLGLLAKRLPKDQRARALSYGLIGAFVFRILAILLAGFLLQWTVAKLIGGGYLIFIALKHLLSEPSDEQEEKLILDEEGQPKIVDAYTGESLDIARENIEIEQRVPIGAGMVTDSSYSKESSGTTKSGQAVCNVARHSVAAFWRTVLVIELTDIAFAVDSILAAMALAGSNPAKLWVVIVGGILGVILMRFAAAMFIKLLDRFPRFELTAYLLVVVIGLKLVLDWGCNSDWSFNQTPWLASRLGGWKQSFESFERERVELADRYQIWLKNSWPFGVADQKHENVEGDATMPRHVAHILDFHDFRRPESLSFWALMATCFGIGFVPRKQPATQP